MATAVQSEAYPAFLAGGGETARLIADFDWSRTSLGPIDDWPAAVKSTVALLLRAPLPIVTLWGEPGVMIYNDAYSEFAGRRHPDLLGMDVRDAWPEVADFNDNIVRTVFRAGENLSLKSQELSLYREGRPDTVWLDLDYSPIVDEDGTRLGVIAIVVEQTDKVLADQALLGERERLRQMYEQSPSFKALLEGPDHRYAMVNDAYRRLVGDRELIGRPLAEVVPEAVEQGFLDLLDRAYSSGEPIRVHDARVELDRGDRIETRSIDFVHQPVSDTEGRITGIFIDGFDVTERILAQQAILASERQFQTFAQSMPNHVWTSPPDGQLDWFNDRVFDYSGLAADQLEGVLWADIVHPDDRDDAADAWGASLAAGTTYETEFRIRRHDGEYRWHLVRALPILAADGTISRWIGTNTDIHDQKLAEAQSSRDRDRLWALTQDFLLVCDLDGVITSVNPSATRMLGFAQEEMVGRRLAEYLHPDDVAATASEVTKLSSGATTLAFENRYRTADGRYRLIDWTAVPEGDRIHGVGRDITEERRLARDRERAWTLSPIVKIVADADGTVIAVNPSWTESLGWTSEETVGRNILTFLADIDRAGGEDRLASLRFHESEVIVSRRHFRARDGEAILFDWTTVPEGDALYLFGRDLSAEVAAAEALEVTESALRQSQKMEAVGQLTGGIAHDFNNLLQGITGSLEIIQRRVAQRRFDDLDRFITGATGAANRAAALTHRLLAFSRRQPLDPRAVRVNPLLSSMEDLLRRTIGEGMVLDLIEAPDAWLTRCDPNQLENAILNLVINARDAMPDGGKVTIETRNARLGDADHVLLAVSDTGVGMSPDVIARAFEPFFTTKPIGQGTGLGLSMIYGFARQSEGEVKIVSEVGQGTTIELYLPRFLGTVDEEDGVAAANDASAPQAGETILVIEDDPVVRELIVELLGDLGYRTLQAADGARGIEILESDEVIDLLVTDIGLPGLNGRQVADAARVARPGLRILFMTGYAENAALACGFLEAGMAMITKPFAIDVMTSRVREMLDAHPPSGA